MNMLKPLVFIRFMGFAGLLLLFSIKPLSAYELTKKSSQKWLLSESREAKNHEVSWGRSTPEYGQMLYESTKSQDAVTANLWNAGYEIKKTGRSGRHFRYLDITRYNLKKNILETLTFKFTPPKGYVFAGYTSPPLETRYQACEDPGHQLVIGDAKKLQAIINDGEEEDFTAKISLSNVIERSCKSEERNRISETVSDMFNSGSPFMGCFKNSAPKTATIMQAEMYKRLSKKSPCSLISCSNQKSSEHDAELRTIACNGNPFQQIILNNTPRGQNKSESLQSYLESLSHEMVHRAFSIENNGIRYNISEEEKYVTKLAKCCANAVGNNGEKCKLPPVQNSRYDELAEALKHFPSLNVILGAKFDVTDSVLKDLEIISKDRKAAYSEFFTLNPECEQPTPACIQKMNDEMTKFQNQAMIKICRRNESGNNGTCLPDGLEQACTKAFNEPSQVLISKQTFIDIKNEANLRERKGLDFKHDETAEIAAKVSREMDTEIPGTVNPQGLQNKLAFVDTGSDRELAGDMQPTTISGEKVPVSVARLFDNEARQLSVAEAVFNKFEKLIDSRSDKSGAQDKNNSESSSGSWTISSGTASKSQSASQSPSQSPLQSPLQSRTPASESTTQNSAPESRQKFSDTGENPLVHPQASRSRDTRVVASLTLSRDQNVTQNAAIYAKRSIDTPTTKRTQPTSRRGIASVDTNAVTSDSAIDGEETPRSPAPQAIQATSSARSTQTKPTQLLELPKSGPLPTPIVSAIGKIINRPGLEDLDREDANSLLARRGIRLVVGNDSLGSSKKGEVKRIFRYSRGGLQEITPSTDGGDGL